jgi:hypothetical protein
MHIPLEHRRWRQEKISSFFLKANAEHTHTYCFFVAHTEKKCVCRLMKRKMGLTTKKRFFFTLLLLFCILRKCWRWMYWVKNKKKCIPWKNFTLLHK